MAALPEWPLTQKIPTCLSDGKLSFCKLQSPRSRRGLSFYGHSAGPEPPLTLASSRDIVRDPYHLSLNGGLEIVRDPHYLLIEAMPI
jgi:hypothetical protein